MPIIQEALKYFTRIWNIYTIRKQPKHLNCISSQPFKNYIYLGAIGYKKQKYLIPKYIIKEFTKIVENISITARLPNTPHCQLAS